MYWRGGVCLRCTGKAESPHSQLEARSMQGLPSAPVLGHGPVEYITL